MPSSLPIFQALDNEPAAATAWTAYDMWVNAGGTLDLRGKNQIVAGLESNNPLPGMGGIVTSSTGPAILTTDPGAMTFSGSITGSGLSLAKGTANALTLTNANTYGGTTTVMGPS